MTSPPTGPTPADFDAWNVTKKSLHNAARTPIFKDAEVWWVALGVNIGVETYGKGPMRTRPVVVIRKVSRHGGLVMPVTTRPQTRDMYHPLDWGAGPRWAMMHETKSVSVFRFRSRIATLSDVEFRALRQAFCDWVGQ